MKKPAQIHSERASINNPGDSLLLQRSFSHSTNLRNRIANLVDLDWLRSTSRAWHLALQKLDVWILDLPMKSA